MLFEPATMAAFLKSAQFTVARPCQRVCSKLIRLGKHTSSRVGDEKAAFADECRGTWHHGQIFVNVAVPRSILYPMSAELVIFGVRSFINSLRGEVSRATAARCHSQGAMLVTQVADLARSHVCHALATSHTVVWVQNTACAGA